MKNSSPQHPRARTLVICRAGHRHEVCVRVSRGLPPSLRCTTIEPSGFAYGTGSGGCVLPVDLEERAMRELRENMQECIRRGYVLVSAK